jgi:hypothetical protein
VISGLAVCRRQLRLDLIHDRERGDVGAGGHRRRGLEDIEGEVREGQRPSLADDASPMDEYERGGGWVEGSCE